MSTGGLQDIAPGGESTQYESIQIVTNPHSKEGGRLGELQTSTSTQKGPSAERGAKTAENIRYGQAISEHDMGGQTLGNSGETNTDVGYGGTAEANEAEESAGKTRGQAGYGAGRDMDKNVGA